MNALRILFKANRFNLSTVGEHFINPCCFGEDLAAWLRTKLIERKREVRQPCQEHWGWGFPAMHEGGSNYLSITANCVESSTNKSRSVRVIILANSPCI